MQAIPNSKPFIGGSQETVWVDVDIDLPPLIPGIYHLTFWIGPHNTKTVDYIKDAITIEISSSPSADRSFPHTRDHGFIVPNSTAVLR